MSNEESQVFRTNSHEETGVNEGENKSHKNDRSGPTKSRELHDNYQTVPDALNAKGEVALGKRIEPQFGEENKPVQAPVVAKPAPPPEPEMSFEDKDATPWALSIHLEDRIKSLGVTTARVNKQLDSLEANSKKLKKRIGV